MASPPESIGVVAHLEGRAGAITMDGSSRSLSRLSPVFLNDTLITDTGARMEVIFRDDTRLWLGEQSEIAIDSFFYDPEKTVENRFGGALRKGFSRVVTGRIPRFHPGGFEIRTTHATIGIRGCDIAVETSEAGDRIFILSVPPGRSIFVHAVVGTESGEYDEPCLVSIGLDGRIDVDPMTDSLQTEVIQATEREGGGEADDRAEYGGGEQEGGGEGNLFIRKEADPENPFRPVGRLSDDQDAPATPI